MTDFSDNDISLEQAGMELDFSPLSLWLCLVCLSLSFPPLWVRSSSKIIHITPQQTIFFEDGVFQTTHATRLRAVVLDRTLLHSHRFSPSIPWKAIRTATNSNQMIFGVFSIPHVDLRPSAIGPKVKRQSTHPPISFPTSLPYGNNAPTAPGIVHGATQGLLLDIRPFHAELVPFLDLELAPVLRVELL
jgi:hypothetical protein